MAFCSSRINRAWVDDILPLHTVPAVLHPWQCDAITSILNGDNVALCVPTGSGKTLPQLTTSLFYDTGVGIVIPPLISIELQMEAICKKWAIPYVNLAGVVAKDIVSHVASSKAKLVISSIESISDEVVQKKHLRPGSELHSH